MGKTFTLGQYPNIGISSSGTPTTNYLPKFTGASTIGDSLVYDTGSAVGIGTTSPADLLEVKGGFIRLSATTGNGPQFNIYSNGQTSNHITLAQGFALATDNIGYLYNRANADFVFGTNNTERLRITSTGTIQQPVPNTSGLFYTIPTNSYTGYVYSYINNAGGSYYLGIERLSGSGLCTNATTYSTVLTTNNATNLTLGTNGIARMMIFSNGAVSMGQNVVSISGFTNGSLSGPFGSVGATSRQTQGIAWGTYSTNSGLPNYMGNWGSSNFWGMGTHTSSNDSTLRFGVVTNDANGAYWTGGYANIYAGSYTNGSDYRMKENINFIESVLDKVLNLNPVRYNIKDVDDRENLTKEDIGFIAHEVQEYFPEFVYGSKDQVDVEGTPIHQGLDYAKMVAVLTKAIQELNAKVTALENK